MNYICIVTLKNVLKFSEQLYVPHSAVDVPGLIQTWLPVQPEVSVQTTKKLNPCLDNSEF